MAAILDTLYRNKNILAILSNHVSLRGIKFQHKTT